MSERQIRSVVSRADGSEEMTAWFRDGDPAAVDALKAILRSQRIQGYVVWWETRDVEGAMRARV